MRYILSICVFCLLLPIGSEADASLQVGSKIQINTGLPGTYGGRFGVTDGGSPAGKEVSAFATFCVELTERIANNGVYTVTGISDTTVLGGRTLTSYAAWLYTEFRQGTLNGFDYSTMVNAQTTNDANALQYALWREMGYDNTDVNNTLPGTPAASYEALYTAKTWATDFANDASWSGIGNVRIINLKTQDGKHAQDQLVLVPEASTIVVWSALSLIGFVAVYRRVRKSVKREVSTGICPALNQSSCLQ